MGLTALIGGIGAFIFGWVPALGFILGAAATVFGILALVKKQSKGMGITGIPTRALLEDSVTIASPRGRRVRLSAAVEKLWLTNDSSREGPGSVVDLEDAQVAVGVAV